MRCELTVDTDPIGVSISEGNLDEAGHVDCDASSILRTSETACHRYRAKLLIDRIESEQTGWTQFTTEVAPQIASVEHRTIRVVDLASIEDTGLSITLEN